MLDLLAWAAIAASLIVPYVLIQKRGFPYGAWVPFFCVVLLVPAWFEKSLLFGLGTDPRSACCFGIVVAMLTRPLTNGGAGFRTIALDYCIGGIVLSQIAAQLANAELRPMTAFEILRQIALPYFVGRIFLSSPWDVYAIARAAAVPLGLISLYGVLEAVSHTNIAFGFFGKFTAGLQDSVLYRWGLKRAMGLFGHPIFFALMLCLMLPWVLDMLHSWWSFRQPAWGYLPAVLTLAGILCTVSRSGQFGAMFVLAADTFFRFPRVRKPILGLLIVGGLTVFTFRDDIVGLLERVAGEEADATPMVIKGEPVLYTGTKHRDLLHLIYGEEADRAGWFGWGFEMSKMPRDPNLPNQFKSVDDHYLLTQLRFGIVGVGAFLAFTVVGCWCLFRVAMDQHHPAARFAGGAFGAFLGVALMIRSVSMEADIAFPWYFLAGVGGRLYSMKLDARDAARLAGRLP